MDLAVQIDGDQPLAGAEELANNQVLAGKAGGVIPELVVAGWLDGQENFQAGERSHSQRPTAVWRGDDYPAGMIHVAEHPVIPPGIADLDPGGAARRSC